MTSRPTDNKLKVSPVYIRSVEHTWIPALQLKVHNGKATVAVPKFASEQAMMDCAKGNKLFRYHENQIIRLSDYTNGVLPMQNVDCDGNLEDHMDMVNLPFMHEAAILYNLKLRHTRQKPYTRTGDIVIAINPYQWYHELYTEEKRNYYSNRLIWEQSAEDPRAVMQPHIYEVSALAYKGLAMGECRDQSILVSGESGAGKTESVKICLNHIASAQRGLVPTGYAGDTKHDAVIQRVIESNPLLEAFGNAQTRRNDNSSRFGKYLQLQFQKQVPSRTDTSPCCLVGSKCSVYLLETNRVIVHDATERNFHIFYQLLAAPDSQKAQFWERLRGAKTESFKYIGHTKTTVIEGMTDAERFQCTLKALALVGIEGQKLKSLMQALCIVLQLGNLGFHPLRGDADKAAVHTSDDLVVLSKLMGVSQSELEVAFTERTFVTDKETHKVPLNAESAKEACDALAKEAYQKIFLWLVTSINNATSANESNGQAYGKIGLLDIFGFEVFPQNRFEQLCINYANEKLQQKFNEDIFKNVQAEYKAEGIPLHEITYADNSDVIDLIEGRTGLLNLLNEECIRPKGNDIDYVHKALRLNRNAEALVVHRTDRLSFGINHYAGVVMYDIDGFVRRNIDTLTTDLQACAEKCSNAIISAPRSDLEVSVTRKIGAKWAYRQSNIIAPTVWTKYKSQLSNLMSNLRTTQSRYIRCIKPNGKKEPNTLEHEMTVDQLRCAGVVAGISIARSSFPNRLPNSVVLARFSHLWNRTAYPSKHKNGMGVAEKRKCDCVALLVGALKSKETKGANGKIVQAFAVGNTKTYFRTGALEFLESCRRRGLDGPACIIQRAARRWLSRNSGARKMQLQQMESAERERARKAEVDRQRKLAREAADRRAAHQSRMKILKDQIAQLERACADVVRDQERSVQAAKERTEKSKLEMHEMRRKFEAFEDGGHMQRRVEKVAQLKLLEENNKMIRYLKQENIRARKENAKVQSKLTATERMIYRGEDMKESMACKAECASRVLKAGGVIKTVLEQTKSECKVLDIRVRAMQDTYMVEAKARLQLQKSIAQIVTIVQERIRNRSLVEETIITALKAEACSKSVMAALDVASLQPDLTESDMSSSDSSWTDL